MLKRFGTLGDVSNPEFLIRQLPKIVFWFLLLLPMVGTRLLFFPISLLHV